MPKSKTTKKGRSQRRNNDPLVQKPGALNDATARKKKDRDIQFRDEVPEGTKGLKVDFLLFFDTTNQIFVSRSERRS